MLESIVKSNRTGTEEAVKQHRSVPICIEDYHIDRAQKNKGERFIIEKIYDILIKSDTAQQDVNTVANFIEIYINETRNLYVISHEETETLEKLFDSWINMLC